MNKEEQGRKMGQIISKAWSDDVFKQKLLTSPTKTMKEEGMAIPDEIEVRIVENTDKVTHLIIPPAPRSDLLSDDELARIVGGGSCISDVGKLFVWIITNILCFEPATWEG